MAQRCPYGSMNWPVRSPQNASCNGSNTVAPRFERPLPHRGGLVDGDVQGTVGAAERQRRDHAHVGKLVGYRQHAVAEP